MRRLPLLPLLLLIGFPTLAPAQQTTPGPATPPAARLIVKDTTRVEVWRFFEPPAGGGNPNYAFVANRLFAGVELRRTRVDATAALQYVQFGGLPEHATGPGPLGTGAQYFDHAGSTTSHQVYLRTLFVRLKNVARGVNVQAGRFGYASGAESASGDAKIEAVKRQRLDSRLIGEFEWSIYQRAFDGARVDVDRRAWHATASWFEPTQGGFEEQAGRLMRHVSVAAVTVSARPNPALRHTDLQGFVYRYDDSRPVRSRPDNTLQAATSVDVHITSAGTSLVGAYPAGPKGQVDVLGWLVWQGGHWYGQTHRANAVAAELGYERPKAKWRPWVRGGWFRSSGDGHATDARHGTFFQMLPTARRYSLSTAYNLMNLSEVFGQVIARPRTSVTMRFDIHHLRLTDAADLWYAGSGATQRAGTTFGFSGRRSNGSTDLGTMVEGAADWAVSPHLSLNGYLGHLGAGYVVGKTFAGRTMNFGYLETIVTF